MSFSQGSGYRGLKGDLFRRLAAGDVVRPPSRIRSDIDLDEDLPIHWRTFYRYIADFCRDGHAVRRDYRVGGYVMVMRPEDIENDLVEVRLTFSQVSFLLEVLDEYGAGINSNRSLLGGVRDTLGAAIYGEDPY